MRLQQLAEHPRCKQTGEIAVRELQVDERDASEYSHRVFTDQEIEQIIGESDLILVR